MGGGDKVINKTKVGKRQREREGKIMTRYVGETERKDTLYYIMDAKLVSEHSLQWDLVH